MRKAALFGLRQGREHLFHETQYREGIELALGLCKESSSDKWDDHFRRATASAMVAIIYGKDQILSESDPTIARLNDFISRLTRAALPGAHLVESLPFLRHLPSRYPLHPPLITILLPSPVLTSCSLPRQHFAMEARCRAIFQGRLKNVPCFLRGYTKSHSNLQYLPDN